MLNEFYFFFFGGGGGGGWGWEGDLRNCTLVIKICVLQELDSPDANRILNLEKFLEGKNSAETGINYALLINNYYTFIFYLSQSDKFVGHVKK